MPVVSPFASFDVTPYQSAPLLPLQTLVVLVDALYSRVPVPAPGYVKKGAEEMRTAGKEAGKAMVVRLRETNEISLAADINLDNGMDALFTWVRDGLRGYRVYLRPGFDFLLQDPDWHKRIEELREKAKIATSLFTKLFGEGNLDMLKREFPEQSQLMTNVIALIDEDKLEPQLNEVLGPDVVPLLRRANDEYRKMVDRRTTAENASKADLRAARQKLQRRIVSYASLVLTMLNEDKPATLTIVENALRPMVTMRVSRKSTTPTTAEAEQDADFIFDPEADLQAVLAQAQAELEEEGLS